MCTSLFPLEEYQQREKKPHGEGGGGGFEQPVSRILFLHSLATTQVAIIYLGRQLPAASSDQPES
jgi:hypothetical protein